MNIVLLPSPPFEEIGGVSTHVYMLANGLTELGHNVQIVPERPPKIYRALLVVIPSRIIMMVNVHYAQKYIFYAKALFYTLSAIVRAKFGKIDIINLQNVQYFSVAHFLQKLTGGKMVLTVHGFLTYEAEAGKWCFPGDKTYNWLWKLETKGYGGCDSIIGVSKKVANYVNQFTRKKITVINNGINTSLLIPPQNKTLDKKVIKILFAGVLEIHKGFTDALEAVNILVKNNKKVLLYIAGTGPGESYITEYVDKKGLTNNVKLLGLVNKRKMPGFYSLGDIFICPSKKRSMAGPAEEAFPYTVLEAMACGLPVVAYNTGGIKDQVVPGKTGFLVEPGNVNELANKIAALIDRNDLRNEMSQNARKRVIDHFSHKTMARQFLNVYRTEVV